MSLEKLVHFVKLKRIEGTLLIDLLHLYFLELTTNHVFNKKNHRLGDGGEGRWMCVLVGARFGRLALKSPWTVFFLFT
jgi:hypothetical protein